MLGSKKNTQDREAFVLLATAIQSLSIETGKVIAAQRESSQLFKALIHKNEEFLSTLTSFLSHEDQRRMREKIREEEDALSKTPTKADKVY